MKLTVMMLELIANKMRLVAYTDVRVLNELGVLLIYSSRSCFAVTLHAFWFQLRIFKLRSNINVLHTLSFLSNILFDIYVDK